MSKSIEEKIKQIFKAAKNPSVSTILFGSFAWITRLNRLEKQVLALLDAKVVVEKEKLQELADLLKTRPSWEWMKDNLDKLEEIESAFRRIEWKFAELTKEMQREK